MILGRRRLMQFLGMAPFAPVKEIVGSVGADLLRAPKEFAALGSALKPSGDIPYATESCNAKSSLGDYDRVQDHMDTMARYQKRARALFQSYPQDLHDCERELFYMNPDTPIHPSIDCLKSVSRNVKRVMNADLLARYNHQARINDAVQDQVRRLFSFEHDVHM